MPKKQPRPRRLPAWAGQLEEIIQHLTALPCPDIDTAQLANALGVKRRRAQIILEPVLNKRTVGSSALVSKEAVIHRLRELVADKSAEAEKERRARLHRLLDSEAAEVRQPRVLVEAPLSILRQQLEDLPAGVQLSPGRIVVEGFRTVEEAQQKILALVMAMGNDPEGFANSVKSSD